jgi:hypothetical protein
VVDAGRSPEAYPDAVSLDPAATADDVLSLVDAGPGCSVKDSFAALDLRSAGFDVLFEAQWIHREPAEEANWNDVVVVAAKLFSGRAAGRLRDGGGFAAGDRGGFPDRRLAAGLDRGSGSQS